MQKFEFSAYNTVANTDQLATITANLRKQGMDVRVKDIQSVAKNADDVMEKDYINSHLSERDLHGLVVQGVSGKTVFYIERKGGDWNLKKVEARKPEHGDEEMVLFYTLSQKMQRKRLKREFFSAFYADRQSVAA